MGRTVKDGKGLIIKDFSPVWGEEEESGGDRSWGQQGTACVRIGDKSYPQDKVKSIFGREW